MEREETALPPRDRAGAASAEAYSWLACQLSLSRAPRKRSRSAAGPWSSSRSRPTSTSTRPGRIFSSGATRRPSPVFARRWTWILRGLRALGPGHGVPGRRPARGGDLRAREADVLTGRQMPWSLALLGSSLATSGRVEAARAVLAEIEGLAPTGVRSSAPPRLRPGGARARRLPALAACSGASHRRAQRLSWVWPRRGPGCCRGSGRPGARLAAAGRHPSGIRCPNVRRTRDPLRFREQGPARQGGPDPARRRQRDFAGRAEGDGDRDGDGLRGRAGVRDRARPARGARQRDRARQRPRPRRSRSSAASPAITTAGC